MWDWGCLVWDVQHRMYDVHCKYAEHVRCFPFLLAYVLLMRGAWVKNNVEGAEWSFQKSVSAAARYLRVQSVKLHDAQVSQEAKHNGARDGWRFTTDLNTVAPRNATVVAKPRAAPSIPTGLAGANRVCGACDTEFGGHLKKCVSCGKQTHELCGTVAVQHKFHCYMCLLTRPVIKCAHCRRTACAHRTTAIGDAVHCKGCASPPPQPSNGRRRLFR